MSFWLIMKTADGHERPFPIRADRTVIGREPRSDVRVAIPTVGASHCEIRFADNRLKLTDLNGGGTFHNGSPVSEATLRHLDRITIGPVTFEVREVTDASQNGELTPKIEIAESARKVADRFADSIESGPQHAPSATRRDGSSSSM